MEKEEKEVKDKEDDKKEVDDTVKLYKEETYPEAEKGDHKEEEEKQVVDPHDSFTPQAITGTNLTCNQQDRERKRSSP